MQIIKTWLDLNLDQHIFLNLTQEVNIIINPLIKHFGLDSFNYHKTYNDNSQIRLTNKPNWIKHYLTNKLYLSSIFELPANNYVKSCFIWSNIGSHHTILQEAKKFEIDYGITFVKPVFDGCEFYFLGTTSGDSSVINNYLNNFYLLEKFIANFSTLAQQILVKVERKRLISQDLGYNQLNFQVTKNIDEIEFLALISGYSFTKRELDCIVLLLKGQTSKQIAKILRISYRTVEVYINNLKNKTNTATKNDLIYFLSDKFG